MLTSSTIPDSTTSATQQLRHGSGQGRAPAEGGSVRDRQRRGRVGSVRGIPWFASRHSTARKWSPLSVTYRWARISYFDRWARISVYDSLALLSDKGEKNSRRPLLSPTP
jgi:hypothetical protein